MEDRSGLVNILVVDDMPVNIELLTILLEPRGYHITGATSGADALKIIDKSVPDLILLDVKLNCPMVKGWVPSPVDQFVRSIFPQKLSCH